MPETPVSILVMTDPGDDDVRIEQLLKEAGIPARVRTCRDPEALRTVLSRDGADLVLCRFEAGGTTATEVDRYRRTLDDAPGLILLTRGARPEDFLRAAKCAADDLVDLDMPAQFDFTLRRELENQHLRRRYREARRELTEERVIDDARLDESRDMEALSPMADTIDDALANDRMELLFQPILSVTDDGHENHEVFLRIHNGQEQLMPREFIPVAERYGLMPAIDRWVVRHAIERFREEQAKRERGGEERALRLFVNLSLHTLVDPVSIREIIGNIRKAKLPAGSFVIELDKNTILSRLKLSKSLNRGIRKMGLQFSMDHYGIDDTSLNYLEHVHLDFIKLNQDLVRDIHRNTEHMEQVRRIVSLAHESGIRVVASQVEHAGELAELYDAGVDHVQGYLIAEPSNTLQEGVGLDEIAAESADGG